MELQVFRAEELRNIAEEYIKNTSDELARGHYMNILDAAKRGRFSATIRFANPRDSMTEINLRALEKLEVLFPNCEFTFIKGYIIRSESIHIYEVSWVPIP